MRPTLIVPPAVEPVTLEDLKAHARVDFDDDDGVLSGYLKSAVQHLDGYRGVLGRCMVNQGWSVSFSAWSPVLPLPFPDVSVAVVTYLDGDGLPVVLDAAQYELIEGATGARLVFHQFSAPLLYAQSCAPITVSLTAGFGPAATDVPAPLVHAIKLLAAHWYENREAVGKVQSALPMGVAALISPYRWVSV